MNRVRSGPFKSVALATADSVVATKETTVGSYSFVNASVAAITVTFYDDVTAGSPANPIEGVVVPANGSVNLQLGCDTENGLAVKASSWTSLTGYVRVAGR